MESTSIFLVFFLCSFSLLSECRGAPATPSVQAKALIFMQKFGYLEGSEDGSAAQPLLDNITDEKFKEGIKEVQRFLGFEITGELDEKTLEFMSAKRCGVPDIVKDSVEYSPTNEELPSKFNDTDEYHHEQHQHQHHHHHHHPHHHSRRKRYILMNRGWKKRHITYHLANWSEKLTRGDVLEIIKKSLANWAKYGDLRFTEVSSPDEADIVFGFYRRQHGDGSAFDGPGNVLAHAFAPSSYDYGQKGLEGDVHFDAEEPWVIDAGSEYRGVDLMATAVHELGHSLGFAHSPHTDSVMYPNYIRGKHELGYDDILAMYELYVKAKLRDDSGGAKYIPPKPTRPPLTRRTTITSSTTTRYVETTTEKKHLQGSIHVPKTPDGCKGAFDTVAFIRGELFITKNKMLWRLSEPGKIQEGYPVEFWRMFALPKNVKRIDAMYEREKDSAIVIFSGSQFWVSDGNVLSSPRPLTDYGLPWRITKVDGVTVRDGSTYIFSELQYWTYDDEKKTLVNSSRPLSDWGFPPNSDLILDSVMTYKDGNTYFFKGQHYWEYNGRLMHPRNRWKSASQFLLSC
ncbi:unnamed protein product [Nezara viridula]|uniref:Peptidase metallopeptidase domain-containing protein n=1 Tax=Nezara viridula TaxID=85310 RepID=A0A9P0MSB2_NEZVI|nr:unnamed protein product [Nezara viridula]